MIIRSLTALAAAALVATGASAASFSFAGTFARDNDKAAYNFTVAAPTVVTLTSLGYAGGTSASGALVAAGGFDTVLSLYDSTGTAVDFNDDGIGVPTDSTGHASDAKLSLSLGAGTYKVYLTQYNNFGPITLGNGFAFDGQPNFRGGFVDLYGSVRDGHWALDLSGVDSAVAGSVPEAATWAMMIGGFFAVGAMARRRQFAVAA